MVVKIIPGIKLALSGLTCEDSMGRIFFIDIGFVLALLRVDVGFVDVDFALT
jgi:hypothetical protein